ncbi:hypothetical protein AA0614_2407 [Komagataeibacter saccharivorans NRIC 0614]|nr:hypothetical protein AA0614_2407 [Komagataeibacter saccharivorans NRIC 0614]
MDLAAPVVPVAADRRASSMGRNRDRVVVVDMAVPCVMRPHPVAVTTMLT